VIDEAAAEFGAIGPALKDPVNLLDMVDTTTPAFGAYQFTSAASFRISLSSVGSATAA
jgi:hypothetical protein